MENARVDLHLMPENHTPSRGNKYLYVWILYTSSLDEWKIAQLASFPVDTRKRRPATLYEHNFLFHFSASILGIRIGGFESNLH